MSEASSRPERLEALEARLGALEAENRRLRRSQKATRTAVALLLVVPLLAAVVARPDFSDEVLDVRGLNIVDGEGVHRIGLGLSPDTVTQSANFYGRTFIRNSPPGAHVLFFDDEGTEQGGIGIPDDGGISLGLDSRTAQNISLGTSADGRRATIRFWTVAGGERREATFGITADAGPLIRLVEDGEVVFQVPEPEASGADGDAGSDR